MADDAGHSGRDRRLMLDMVSRAGPIGEVDVDGLVRLDPDRELRSGAPEIIFASGESDDQLIRIAKAYDGDAVKGRGPLAFSRLSPEAGRAIKAAGVSLRYDDQARMGLIGPDRTPFGDGLRVAVVCAGTSDIPTAEEAARLLCAYGNEVVRIYDVGVAGLHRLLSRVEIIRAADICIIAAGMEGALPSVVAGLTTAPCIAVPTSVGYGASFGGVAALLGMLNSCSPGLSVVNIDNGVGAAMTAHQFLARMRRHAAAAAGDRREGAE